MYMLPDTERMTITETPISERVSTFVIEPLAPGYGMTIGHSLRRVLLTSLEGAAVAYVKITGVDHEFTTHKGMKEDIVELMLNLKALRVRSESAEPVVLHLDKKGPGVVTAGDFTPNSDITITDPEHHLATLDKNGKLSMDVTIERGRGYLPTERRILGQEKLPLGTIAVDSIFSPIKRVHYNVEHTRVGGQTDYDKLTLELTTDGSITPADAMSRASQILVEHFGIVRDAAMATSPEAADDGAEKKPAKKRAKKVATTTEDSE